MSLNNLLTPINNLLTYLQRLLLKDLGGLEEKRRLALAPHNLRVHVREALYIVRTHFVEDLRRKEEEGGGRRSASYILEER